MHYMLIIVSVKDQYRDDLAAIVHVDGSARIQVVTEEEEMNPKLYSLLIEFEKLTGYAVLLNTSFNLHEPIVCSPKDAIRTFNRTGLDYLFVGDFVVKKP
jgi:carbamoyltransferase